MLISFSGIDGCGKTTIAQHSVKFFKKNGGNALYKRLSNAGLARKAGNAVKVVSGSRAKTVVRSNKPAFSLFRKFSLVFDALAFRLVLLHARISKKNIVCDRYFFDSIVHLNFLGIRTKYFERLLFAIAPKPDITSFIYVRSEEAMQRDKDFSKEFYKKKDALYSMLFEKISHLRVENTNLSQTLKKVEQTIEEVKAR